jgi:hypothetical protein
MGGMWYMNNIGYLNIGSLLSRLGITIWAGKTGATIERGLENVVAKSNENNNITRGFFRQLGERVLEIIDIYIEKMKEKRQKYK